jgi:hypothetical protein
MKIFGIMEPLLAMFPRSVIDRAEIHLFSDMPPGDAGTKRRVAFVKSDVCGQLYTRPGSSRDLASLAKSTLKTFGPLSLFDRLQTDFFIIRLPHDSACQAWREFYADDPDPDVSAKLYESNRDRRADDANPDSPSQGDRAVMAETVDWGRYDAVIAQDLCVPPRITRLFPKTFWSYWMSETGTRSYKNSLHRPAEGYHAFLNGGSRRWRVRPFLRNHTVEFPYICQDTSTHKKLGSLPWEKRAGCLLETNTARRIPAEVGKKLEGFGPLVANIGSPAARLLQLHHCKYFIQMAENRLWGNAMNEAVAAGCLGLANPQSMPNNRSLLLPALIPGTWDELLQTLGFLGANPEKEARLRSWQASLADWYLCARPLRDWLSKADSLMGKEAQEK